MSYTRTFAMASPLSVALMSTVADGEEVSPAHRAWSPGSLTVTAPNSLAGMVRMRAGTTVPVSAMDAVQRYTSSALLSMAR